MTASKCICQICTCGRHRCPHNRGTIGSEPVKAQCQLSEYQCAYETLPKQAPRETIYPPMRRHTSNTPMQISTMYKDTYVKHEHQSKIMSPKREFVPPTKPMSVISTYTQDYMGEPGKRPGNFKPDNMYHASATKFHNKTIYRVSYDGHSPEDWKLCRASPIRHKECIAKNNGKFEGTSTMKDDFKKHENPEKAELILPKPEENPQSAKFVSDTTYKLEFIRKRPEPATSCHPNAEYKPSNVPFVGTTTFMRDYQPHPNPKRQPCYKPQSEYQPCKSKFENKSTASTAYQRWPVQKLEKPVWAKQKSYEKPQIAFVKSSSYQDDFQRPGSGHVRAQLKPQKDELTLEQSRSSTINNFRHTTHYREQFTEYQDADRPKSFKITQVYESPKEPVLGESIYQAKYTGQQSERPKKCIPVVESDNYERKSMTFATTYKETYKGEQQLECPAKTLKDHELTAKNGHQFVEPSDGKRNTPEPRVTSRGDSGNQTKSPEIPTAAKAVQQGRATPVKSVTTTKPDSVTPSDKTTQHPSVTQLNQTISAIKAEIQTRAETINNNNSNHGDRTTPSFCQNCCRTSTPLKSPRHPATNCHLPLL